MNQQSGNIRLLNTYLKEYHAIPPSDLYDGSRIEYLKKDLDRPGIYAITYCSCLRYNLDKCRFTSPTELSISLSHGDKEITTSLDLLKAAWEAYPHLRKEHKSYRRFKRRIIKNSSNQKGEIQKESTDISISLTAPYFDSIVRGKKTTIWKIYVYNMINYLDLDAIISNEIVYLGLSNVSVLHRVSAHDKWGEIAALRPRDRDTLIYFFETCTEEIISGNSRRKVTEISREYTLALVEMQLIHSLKPKYNIEYKSTLPLDGIFISAAKNAGFYGFRIEIDLDGQLGFVSASWGPRCRRMEFIYPFNATGETRFYIGKSEGPIIPVETPNNFNV